MSDLDGVCMIRRGTRLVPADFVAAEFIKAIPEGREVIVKIRRARNPKHHRWWRALLQKVVDNTERWASDDELNSAIKLAIGHTEVRSKLTGEVYLAAKSTNFASMDETAFKSFRERAVNKLCEVLGWDPVILMDEVEDTQRRFDEGREAA